MAAVHIPQMNMIGAAEENAWIWLPKFWRWAAAKGRMQDDKLKVSPQASGKSQGCLQEQVTAAPRVDSHCDQFPCEPEQFQERHKDSRVSGPLSCVDQVVLRSDSDTY